MLVMYTDESPEVGKVTQVLFLPTQEQKYEPNTIDLGDAPIIYPDNIPGMDAVLKVNLIDKVLFYDYYAIETIETKVQTLEKENADLKAQLTEAQEATLELHESQTAQDITISEANTATVELYEILTEKGVI